MSTFLVFSALIILQNILIGTIISIDFLNKIFFLLEPKAPEIKNRGIDSKMTALYGENCILQCNVTGFPFPKISWHFKDITISNGTH